MKFDLDWGVFFQEIPGRRRDVSRPADLGPLVDARRLRLRVGHRDGGRLGDRHDPHDAVAVARPLRQRAGSSSSATSRCSCRCSSGISSIPEFIPPLKAWIVQTNPANAQFLSAVLCLGLFTSARVAEQVRAGIQSLPRGQRMAGMAVGLTQLQVYRFVLLPMAFRIVIPPLTSETMNLIKNSSIALTIGLAELTFRSREMGEYTFHFFEAFTAATLVYVVIAMTANRVMAVVERRVAVPGYIGGGK